MARRLIDLGASIYPSLIERLPCRVEWITHSEGARQMAALFGTSPDALPDQLGWAGEQVALTTHTGTHMDAPWHYGPVCEGRPARTIDQIPLEWCFGPGVVLDLSALEDGSEASVADLTGALATIPHSVGPGDIVLLRTGASRYRCTAEFPEHGCGLGRDATLWLVSQGVHVIGTDAWGLDRPFTAMRDAYHQSHDIRVIWPSHYAGREREYCQIEQLVNLERLPCSGFAVAAFPIKLAGMSGGWVRPVAIVET